MNARILTAAKDERKGCFQEGALNRSQLMNREIELLIANVNSCERCREAFSRAKRILETLPISTSEFALAAQRLRNALAYMSASEQGAAAYELRLLRGQLA